MGRRPEFERACLISWSTRRSAGETLAQINHDALRPGGHPALPAPRRSNARRATTALAASSDAPAPRGRSSVGGGREGRRRVEGERLGEARDVEVAPRPRAFAA